MAKVFSLNNVRFIKRIVVGQRDPSVQLSEEDVKKTEEFINKCLNDFPKGHILTLEKNFNIINIGEHQVVLQWAVYHIGFEKKPHWLE